MYGMYNPKHLVNFHAIYMFQSWLYLNNQSKFMSCMASTTQDTWSNLIPLEYFKIINQSLWHVWKEQITHKATKRKIYRKATEKQKKRNKQTKQHISTITHILPQNSSNICQNLHLPTKLQSSLNAGNRSRCILEHSYIKFSNIYLSIWIASNNLRCRNNTQKKAF